MNFENIPETAPKIDLMVDKPLSATDDDGKVRVMYYNHETKKHVVKEYDTMEDARKRALFVALTLGIDPKQPEKLNAWLTERGFPAIEGERADRMLAMLRQEDEKRKNEPAVKALKDE